MSKNHYVTCQVCGKSFSISQVVPARFVRAPIVELIAADHPNWSLDGYICHDELNQYRGTYVQHVLIQEKGELTDFEHDVIASLREHDILTENLGAAI